jgi:hypothetical protein
MLIALMILRPTGLFGTKEIWELKRKRGPLPKPGGGT